MKKKNLLICLLPVMTWVAASNVMAEDVDLTDLIVNNDFDYIAEGVLLEKDTWKPEQADKSLSQGYKEFYGWNANLEKVGGTSMGINKTKEGKGGNGKYSAWIKNSNEWDDYEFFQIIDKEQLDGGTYKVECLLGEGAGRGSQRLFANQNVQYPGSESEYEKNLLDGEIATFAGLPPFNNNGDDVHGAMKVYTTITDADSLKLGIRVGNVRGDGTVVGKNNCWFRVDYFRLTKIDPVKAANTNLVDITLSVGEIDFKAETITYDVTLPKGTQSVKPTVVAEVNDVIVEGAEEVTLEEDGTGTSTIVVTALDGTTQKTYTINYTADGPATRLEQAAVKADCFVNNGMLTVTGVDAYSVYALNGVKVVEVQNNTSATTVTLQQGIYLVKSGNASVVKVVVK